MNKFRGTAPALITPFNSDLSIDFDGFSRLINHVIDGGADYLVVLGTTGESPTTSMEEKQQILKAAIETNAGRKPIVYGIGGNNTMAVLETIKNTDFNGVDAILSASPYYNKPTQEGIIKHYQMIADACPVPVILYNVPGRTMSNLAATTTLELAKHPNIIGIKEASGNMEQCMKIAAEKPADFLFISGDDMLTTSKISFGCCGVISVLANAWPAQFSTMINKALEGDYEGASALLYKFVDLNDLMYTESNPVGVKAALEILGVCGGEVRMPLLKASDELKAQLKAAMDKQLATA